MTGQAITQTGVLNPPANDTSTQPLTVDAQRRLRTSSTSVNSAGTEVGGPNALDANGRQIAAATPRRLSFPTLTRPADTTAYASGDLIANNVTGASVVLPSITIPPLVTGKQARGLIMKLQLFFPWNPVSVRAYLYHTAQPTFTNGDNGAFAGSGSRDNAMGWIDFTSWQAGVNGDFVAGDGSFRWAYDDATDDATNNAALYLALVATSASTPTSAGVIYANADIVQVQ